jgi:hypothetical protein
VNTKWDTGDIWLRREIDVPDDAIKDVDFVWHHDEAAQVYINGALAARSGQHTTGYVEQRMRDEGRKALSRQEPHRRALHANHRRAVRRRGIDPARGETASKVVALLTTSAWCSGDAGVAPTRAPPRPCRGTASCPGASAGSTPVPWFVTGPCAEFFTACALRWSGTVQTIALLFMICFTDIEIARVGTSLSVGNQPSPSCCLRQASSRLDDDVRLLRCRSRLAGR